MPSEQFHAISSFILCTFVYPQCYGRLIWQNSAYKWSRKYSLLYVGDYKRKKVHLEMKYS